MQLTTDSIKTFMSSESFVVSGVSRDKRKFGYMVFEKLMQTGKKLYPVNPNADKICDQDCFSSIKDVPDCVKNLIILNNKKLVPSILSEAKEKGINNIWVQKGSETADLKTNTEWNELNIISRECIFMWLEPVTSVHKFHRGIRKFFGGLPK